MARVTITPLDLINSMVPSSPWQRSSVPMTTLDATNDMQFVWDSNSICLINNEDAAAVTVTFVGTREAHLYRQADLVLVIPAGNVTPQFAWAGPFDDGFRQADGFVYVNIDAATDARIAVVRVELRNK